MSDYLAQLIVWLNTPMNWIGAILLGFIRLLPGWLSNTLIAAIAGVVFLGIFKVTSNQQAIGRIRNKIKANILAMKLFKDSLSVIFTSQIQLYKGSFLLLIYAIKPILIMIVPVSLWLGQMSLWYQARPLHLNEEAVVTLKLNNEIEGEWPDVNILSMSTAKVVIGPVRVPSKHEIHWKIKACEAGSDPIVFQVGQEHIQKHLAIGEGWMQVSPKRPDWNWSEILLFPLEKPFKPDSEVQSIRIEYPDRVTKFSGTDSWLIYFIIGSMVFALVAMPCMKVKL